MQHVWQFGRAIENYLLPAAAPVAMLALNPAAASALTREVLQTLSVHFFPAAALGVAVNDPKNIGSTVGEGWIKWKDYAADGLKRVASKNKSAEMVKAFADTLLSTMARIKPSVEATLLQLQPLRDQIRDLYLNLSKQSERKIAFKAAIEGHGSRGAAAEPVGGAEAWSVLPEMLSFCAAIAASKLQGKNDQLVDGCRDIISTAQHALCDMFFSYNGIGGSVSPHQLLFASPDCPDGLVCLTVPDNPKSKDSPLTWTGVMCANCGRPAEHHALAVPHEKLQESPGQEHAQFVRALCRVGSIGWHPHHYMAAVHNERHGNLASFTPEACAASLSEYDRHVKCHCVCADSASTSCEKCKPYSLKKCCKTLPHYTEAITAEVIALQKSRREELQHVVCALSAAGGSVSEAPSSSRVKKGGTAKLTVLPPADAPATLIARTGAPAAARPLAAASPTDEAAVSQVMASRKPGSLAENDSAVQPEVCELSALQKLLNRIQIGHMSLGEQKLWITEKSSSELAAAVPDKSDRALLREFAPSPAADHGKKEKEKKKSVPAPAPAPASASSSFAHVEELFAKQTATYASPVAVTAAEQRAAAPRPLGPLEPSASAVQPTVDGAAAALASQASGSRNPTSATADSGGHVLSAPLAASLAPAEAAGPPAQSSAQGGVAASAPSAASLAPAEAAALNVLMSVFAAAGMVPAKDYPALAMKLISKGVAHQRGLNRKIQLEPQFLQSIGMKAGQQNCLLRHLNQQAVAAGGAAVLPEHADAAALVALKSLFEAAGIVPVADYDGLARQLMEQGVADECSLRYCVTLPPPTFDLQSVIMNTLHAEDIMEYLARP
jgi:hypothetical protein